MRGKKARMLRKAAARLNPHGSTLRRKEDGSLYYTGARRTYQNSKEEA